MLSLMSVTSPSNPQKQLIPFFSVRIAAGFPSPAEDHIEKALDLNELCVHHPAATYFVRVQGESMIEAGIHDGDILVIDRSIRARHGHIVIASMDGEMTVKALHLEPPPVKLIPRNRHLEPITLTDDQTLEVFGVVTSVVRQLGV